MGHYAISLNYNFDKNSPDKVIIENFIPFSVKQLLKFDLPSFVKKALQDMDNSTKYPFDSLVEKNRDLMNSNFIVLLEDDEISAIEDNQFFFDDEIPGFTSMWDVVSEANLIYKSYQFQIKERDDISNLSQQTEISRYGLLTMKILVSLLVQLEYRRSQTGNLMNSISVDDIRFLHLFDGEIGSDFNVYNRVNELEERIRNIDNNEVKHAYAIASDIARLIIINNTLNAEDIQREVNENAILRLRRQMLKTLWEPYENEYYSYNVNMAVLRNKRIYRKKDFNSLIDFLQSNDAKDTSQMSSEKIIECVSNIQNSIGNICADNYSNIVVDSFADYFGSEDATRYIKNRYSEGGGSCFALLITDSDKHYFALSGIKEELKPNAGKLAQPVRNIMKILNKQVVPDILAQNYEYNFAYIGIKVAVRRYTQIVSGKNVNPSLYLQRGFETFDKDYANDPTIDYTDTYACCERKLLAYSGYDHAIKIFSRFAPCWKCCPAILEATNVEVFAFDTIDDFIKNGNVSSNNLKKYKISRNSTYSVNII